jgi:hypothetical protein
LPVRPGIDPELSYLTVPPSEPLPRKADYRDRCDQA